MSTSLKYIQKWMIRLLEREHDSGNSRGRSYHQDCQLHADQTFKKLKIFPITRELIHVWKIRTWKFCRPEKLWLSSSSSVEDFLISEEQSLFKYSEDSCCQENDYNTRHSMWFALEIVSKHHSQQTHNALTHLLLCSKRIVETTETRDNGRM